MKSTGQLKPVVRGAGKLETARVRFKGKFEKGLRV